jgi:hypothetical protein
MKTNLTAYHKWLLENFKDRESLSDHIFEDALKKNNQVFELLDRTGDKEYSDETFLKAADLLLTENN